jgi:hypothetical protein
VADDPSSWLTGHGVSGVQQPFTWSTPIALETIHEAVSRRRRVTVGHDRRDAASQTSFLT